MQYTLENIIQKFISVHGNKYDYSKVVYVSYHEKVCVICPEHGEFWITPAHHIRGQGCPVCAGTKLSNTEEFLEKLKKIHGDKYITDKVVYVNNKTKVTLICPVHGEFSATPHNLLKGRGCPECAKTKRVETWRKTNNKPKKETVKKPEKTKHDRGLEFEKKAIEIHEGKYIYHPDEYINSSTKTRITCPEHGDFHQTPGNHLHGKGCPICANIARKNGRLRQREDVIADFRKVHGDKYDYSKFEYVDAHTPSIIICPEHGEFKQNANHHLNGAGCPLCNGGAKYSFDDFKVKSDIIHKNKYTYVDYPDNRREYATIICPIHGEFKQTPDAHLQGKGCPVCGHIESHTEDEIFNLITIFGFECIKHNRSILNGKELDIYIPSERLAIEYCGILWHSEKYRPEPQYHLSKLNECNRQGIKLITIFEDEWLEHKDIVLEKIKHILHPQTEKQTCGGRQCKIGCIDTQTAMEFLNKYHIQGFGSGTVYYGAYNKKDNQLVGVMAFRLDHGKWELTRFATDYHYICPGLGSKMFKTFIKEYNPNYVKSFADRRWTVNIDDNLYTKLGFTLESIGKPDYSYVYKKQRLHKFNFRKQILHKKYNLPLSMTEKEMCDEIGAYRIWNCGLLKYVWQNKAQS